MDRIDAVGVAEWVERERIGAFAAVPTVIHDLLTHPDVRPEQLASLAQPLVGGAACPEEFRALYRERFGADVAIGYGMTEAPTAVTRAEGGPAAAGALRAWRCRRSRSRSAATTAARCLRARRARSASGPRGPALGRVVYTPMLGYWNRPEATAEALAAASTTPATSACSEPTARCTSAAAATS